MSQRMSAVHQNYSAAHVWTEQCSSGAIKEGISPTSPKKEELSGLPNEILVFKCHMRILININQCVCIHVKAQETCNAHRALKHPKFWNQVRSTSDHRPRGEGEDVNPDRAKRSPLQPRSTWCIPVCTLM